MWTGTRSRRDFLGLSLSGAAGLALTRCASTTDARPSATDRFSDLSRHFVFEYYPWYGSSPVRHWNHWDRVPPDDIAAYYFPALGPYDSRSTATIEQHARWIAESGVGAVNLSWWGQDSYEDRATPLVMDVMRDHSIKVAFHLEPYSPTHGQDFADDVLYLLREYGDKRGYDALLILRDADGREGPVFKGFATLVWPTSTDCHGVTTSVSGYTPDDDWLRVLTGLRQTLRSSFDHVTILSDSRDLERVSDAGFDGSSPYDNFLHPDEYAAFAATASYRDLLFSLSVNAGFDAISPRDLPPDTCYQAPPFEPPAVIDWTRADERERAAALSTARIEASFDATVALQTQSTSSNGRRGFFLVYVNTFNEWHEGTAFEPMKPAAALTPAERAIGYRNPLQGDYRLRALQARLRDVLERG